MRGWSRCKLSTLCLLLALAACGKPAAEKKAEAEKPETETGVSLKPEEIKSLGITT